MAAKKKEQQGRPKGVRDLGSRSIEGVEASDLPDERGSVETDYGKEAGRDLPQHTGGTIGGDSGLRGDAAVRRGDKFGGRKKN
jgi:hypothetical protein